METKSKFYLERYFLWLSKKLVNLLFLSLLSTLTCINFNNKIVIAQTDFKSQHIPETTHNSVNQGNQISLNGRNFQGAWLRRSLRGKANIYLSDAALRQLFGVDLLNTDDWQKQPVQWYSLTTQPQTLASWLTKNYRYLNINKFAQLAGWQLNTNGNTLVITTPSTKVTDIQQGKTTGLDFTVNLDHSTPWSLSQSTPVKNANLSDSALPLAEWTITVDGIADPALVQRYTPPPSILTPGNPLPEILPTPQPQPTIKQVEVINNQTLIHLSVPVGFAPQITTLPDPNRLVIDIRPDAMEEHSIAWAPGLLWRQQYVNISTGRFEVVSLDFDPHRITLRPIITNPNTVIGSAPVLKTAKTYLAVAAINGGYFNRNNRFPLGAIRLNGQWLSSPILNRGAIAWNDAGQFYFNRLTWQETLVTANRQLPISFLNSGYVQSGIARYTSAWGSIYTPQTDNEIILVVQGNQIINQLTASTVNPTPIPIPGNGYLIVLRGTATNQAGLLPVGTALRIYTTTFPKDFNNYPQVLAAGPLLLQNGQIVLDGKSEQFTKFFVNHEAVRSGICTTTTGNIMIAAVGGRVGGDGPNLMEHAQIMHALGCVNALNLDGGSSTSLYLGGELLNRPASTAAAVNNGIGVFLQRP